MIQRTLFNKLTVDRIDEVFAHHFSDSLPAQIRKWRDELVPGQIEGRHFYIVINDQYEMEGILLYDAELTNGVLYSRTPEAVQTLLERVRRTGQLRSVSGDSQSIEWALGTNLLTI